MTELSWSHYRGADCLRIVGVDHEADVRVRPRTAVVVGELPAMAGRLVSDGDAVCFLPRFAFLPGTAYVVQIDGVLTEVIVRPSVEAAATTEVIAIRPTSTEVPRNLLRLYVSFSAPMSEGYSHECVRLVDDAGDVLAGALLATEHELWDSERRRLTVLLDPARIKRGLISHREIGYPLRTGESFRVVVDERFRDARGINLRAPAERHYQVGTDQRGLVQPDRWELAVPEQHTLVPFEIRFDRPLDHGLLARCLTVADPDGHPVGGLVEIGPQERSWRLTPRDPWLPGSHQLVVNAVLEDLAGNSVSRVFDRDLSSRDDDPRHSKVVTMSFAPF